MKIAILFFIGLIAYGQCLPPKSRIIGGTPADISDFPYVCSVNAPTAFGRAHVCGCSILSEHWVLTAAHCLSGLDEPRAFQIVVGTTSLDNASASHSVIISYMYPLYANDNENFDFDLAMLKVEIPFELGENVQTIEIAEQDLPDLSDGTIGVIAGWGATEYGGPISFQLNSVELQTINNEECAELNTIQPVTENMLCAHPIGDTDAGMCHGDSGSGFVVDGVVVGIVSNGEGCGQVGIPGITTRVSMFSDWILNILNL